MLPRPPSPALSPPPEAELPRGLSSREGIPEGTALRRASSRLGIASSSRLGHPTGTPEGHPGEDHGEAEGIALEVGDDLAEPLRHLARLRGQPLEALAADLLRRGLDRETRRQQAENALAGLTPRQREVAWLAVGGRTNRQIARELWLSPETVKTHLRRALEHFDLHSKAELRLMLFDLDDDYASSRLRTLEGHPEEDPLRGAPPGCSDATKRDPLRGPLRDAKCDAQREARLPGD